MTTKELKEKYAEEIINGMDLDSLCQFAYEKILENLDDMPEFELHEQIKEYAPHLIETQ